MAFEIEICMHTFICLYSLYSSHNSCVSSNDIAPEGKYPAIFDENSDPVVLGKIKRIKSMQPKSLDEDEITKSGRLNQVFGNVTPNVNINLKELPNYLMVLLCHVCCNLVQKKRKVIKSKQIFSEVRTPLQEVHFLFA